MSDSDLPGNPEKDPDDWTTGDEQMTGAQASYLRTLSQEAGADFDKTLTKAEASKAIDRLQESTGRGNPDPQQPTSDDVERLDEDAPGRSLFEGGDANEPSEPG